MAFTDSQITKWAQDYEREISAKHDLICDRLSLAITSGVYEYELPNYITNIRMVLYLGKELHPKGFRSSIITGDIPTNPSGGSPYEYVVSGKGRRILQLKPTPELSISEYNADLFTMEADRAACIIEFYRTPSITDTKLQLPGYLRKYILKDYVCFKAFANEGPGQDLRAMSYYQGKLGLNEEYLQSIKTNMHQLEVNIISTDNRFNRGQKPARPVLPSNFGYRTTY